ncbi:MAG: hypothetical protein HYZ26_03750 [Chloroflexi bacterium]|nr:hypothetical protein [Chloroflexota bacterium]
MEARALDLLEREGPAAAIAFLEGQMDDPLAAAQAFSGLARHAYNQRKDVDLMIRLAQAGIEFALRASLDATERDADLAYDLSGAAKGLNYDLSANTWPGWADDGIALTAEQMALGCAAAHKNLELAGILDKGDLPLSRARWLVGAHHLAAREFEPARAAFRAAAEQARAAATPGEALLSEGYAQITNLAERGDDAEAGAGLQALLAELRRHEDGEFFARQLETARRIFAGG